MSKAENSNALKHGVYSEMILLPREDREEFKALFDALREEWDPQGPTQEDKVLNIAQNMWRKRRTDRYRKELVVRRFNEEIDLLAQFLEDVDAGKPLSEARLPADAFDTCKRYYPRKDCASDAEWLEKLAYAVVMMINVLDEERKIFIKENILGDRFYDEKEIAPELALQERIDAKIDKDIVSLGRMKTMQSMGLGRRRKELVLEDVSVKQIESPPIQPEPPDELPKVSNTP
jgi:hypothetical protein